MSEKSILIEGEEYISSSRAAKLVGYTKDYVGQLARAGKIKAKRVGRTWYIAESSINKHKLSVHYILTKPKKSRRVEGQVNDENSNKNNDISAIKHTGSNMIAPVGTSPAIHAGGEKKEEKKETDTTAGGQKDSDEYEFIPKLIEKKRDVLVHSDFHFEKATSEPHVFDEAPLLEKEPVSSPETRSSEVRSRVGDFKDVAIRRPLQRNLSYRSPGTQARHLVQDVVRTNVRPVGIDSRIQKSSKPAIRNQVDGIVLQSAGMIQRQSAPRRGFDKRFVQPQVKYEETSHPEYESVNAYKKGYEQHEQHEQDEDTNSSKAIPVIGAIILFTLGVVLYILFTV